MTPEGAVKAKIKKVLKRHEQGMYYYMPVPGGFGSPTLDYLGFFFGHGFAIEAKKPGGKPTDRQRGTIDDIKASGAAVFVIDGDETLKDFEVWLAQKELLL